MKDFTKLLSKMRNLLNKNIHIIKSLIKKSKFKNPGKNLVLRITALVLFMAISSAVMVAAISNVRTVEINYVDLNQVKTVRTFENNINVILSDLSLQNMALGAVDVKEHTDSMTKIDVYKSFNVTLSVDSKTLSYEVARGTVSDLLKLAGTEVNQFDIINYKTTDPLSADMAVQIKRVVYKTVTNEEKLAFATKYLPVLSIQKGKEIVVTKGEFGLAKITSKQTFVDNVLSTTVEVSREIIKKPVNQVVKYGTGGKYYTKNGENFEFLYCLDVKATGYTYANAKIPWADKTASGLPVAVGRIAVDPKIIPLGSKLYVISSDGKIVYGFSVAADTGGAIKGNRIDLFFKTRPECTKLGLKNFKVYVISKP